MRSTSTALPSTDVVALDPLIAINAVQRDNLAVAHHDTKSSAADADNDPLSARGAGDIVNAVHIEVAVRKLTAKQAENFGVKDDMRGWYFRAGSIGSKRNYNAPEDSEWFERSAESLNGEAVVRCIPFIPPTKAASSPDALAEIVAAIGRGTPGGPYSPKLDDGERSLVPVLQRFEVLTPVVVKNVLKLLGTRIEKARWKHPERRKKVLGYRTAEGHSHKWEWSTDSADEDVGDV